MGKGQFSPRLLLNALFSILIFLPSFRHVRPWEWGRGGTHRQICIYHGDRRMMWWCSILNNSRLLANLDKMSFYNRLTRSFHGLNRFRNYSQHFFSVDSGELQPTADLLPGSHNSSRTTSLQELSSSEVRFIALWNGLYELRLSEEHKWKCSWRWGREGSEEKNEWDKALQL
jgi:hypothetical protein